MHRRISTSETSGTTKGDVEGAIADWERLIDQSPERAYLAFSRLDGGVHESSAVRHASPSCVEG